jgi:hypothetical protein
MTSTFVTCMLYHFGGDTAFGRFTNRCLSSSVGNDDNNCYLPRQNFYSETWESVITVHSLALPLRKLGILKLLTFLLRLLSKTYEFSMQKVLYNKNGCTLSTASKQERLALAIVGF